MLNTLFIIVYAFLYIREIINGKFVLLRLVIVKGFFFVDYKFRI